MAKMLLDTCAWFELAKLKSKPIFDELTRQISEGETILITCNIIWDEWSRNKERVVQTAEKTLTDYVKNAKRLSSLLNEKESEKLDSILSQYQLKVQERKRLVHEYLTQVEGLFNGSETYEISKELMSEICELGLNRKAPFHNNKNNIADALIYFGSIDHVYSNYLQSHDIIFVTQNNKDFSDPKNSTKIHPELERENVHYFLSLSDALGIRTSEFDIEDEIKESNLWSAIENQIDQLRHPDL